MGLWVVMIMGEGEKQEVSTSSVFLHSVAWRNLEMVDR